MTVRKGSFISVFGCLFTLFLVALLPLQAERVSSLRSKEGALQFQIHEGKPGKYQLDIEQASDGHVAVRVGDFVKSPQLPVLTAAHSGGLPEGVYRLRLHREGKTVFQAGDPATLWAGEMATAVGEFERRDQLVRWTAVGPSLARVLVMSPSGAILHLLKDWYFVGAGRQEIPWDYRDVSKTVNFSPFPALQVLVQYRELPEGWLVMGSPAWKSAPWKTVMTPKADAVPDDPLDFHLSLEPASGAAGRGNTSVPLPAGTLLKVHLAESSRKALDRQRFEILIYLDGDFFHEESQGVDPYTFVFPSLPSSLSPTYLTVNILDYRGNLGTRSHSLPLGRMAPTSN